MPTPNLFAQAEAARKQEQEQIKNQLVSGNEQMPVQVKKDTKKVNKELTTMTLSLSKEDKRRFKILAMEQGLTASGLLHKWIEESL